MRWALAVTILALTGCTGQRDDLGTVSGTVTLDGAPAQDAYLEFVAEDPGGSTA